MSENPKHSVVPLSKLEKTKKPKTRKYNKTNKTQKHNNNEFRNLKDSDECENDCCFF